MRNQLATEDVGKVERHGAHLLPVAPAKRRAVRDSEHRVADVQPQERLPAQARGGSHAFARGGDGVEAIRPPLDAHKVPPEQVEPGRLIPSSAIAGRCAAHEADPPLGRLVVEGDEAAVGVCACAACERE